MTTQPPTPPLPPLPTPATIGPYPIERELGRGGMGVVYLGRDPRLNRQVAIKVLPEDVARDPMRLSRFEREARTLAALNHRNIGLIYGLDQVGEQRLLVLEFVPGLTLTQRLIRGPISMDEALRVCVQVAEGLEAAHERDVIHRDLKPDNLKITPDGALKILDFGLATSGQHEAGTEATTAASGAGPLTQQGMVMGTPGYMSPEQARGLPLDKRTDIWAFGCVLYECLTGIRCFNGLTPSDMLVAVIEREPDYSALPARTSNRIRDLVKKCLVKDPRRRLRDIGDARNEIEDVLSQPQSGWYRAAGPAGADRPRVVARLSMPLAGDGLANASRSSIALSPDGQSVAFIAGRPPQTRLYIRRFDNADPHAIPGTTGAEAPFFSPDGAKVAFFEGGRLKRVSLSGGAPVTLCAASRPQGGCWVEPDFIYFIPDWQAPLMRIPGGGGTPEPVVQPDMAAGEIALLCPEILPTGNTALMAVWTGSGYDSALIVAVDLRTGQRRPLVHGGMNPRYADSGHLIFTRAGTLMAVAFDADRLEVFGQPVPVEDQILGNALGGSSHFDVGGDAAGGALVFARGPVWEPHHSMLVADRAGQTTPMLAEPRAYVAPAISPDGARLAVQVQGASDHIYLYDLGRGSSTRLTFHGDNGVPVWSPDGSRLAFRSNMTGKYEIYWVAADGAGAPELLFTPADTGPSAGSPAPSGFTRDGRHLIFTLSRPQGGAEIWMVAVGDHPPHATARPIVQSPRNAWGAGVSPDGRYIAYSCDELGREEVYIQQISPATSATPAPATGAPTVPAGRRQITSDAGSPAAAGVPGGGGSSPVWLPGPAGELAYRCGEQIMAVRIATEPAFMVGRPRLLVQSGPGKAFLPSTLLARNYDAMPDGQRFVVVCAEEDRSRTGEVGVVLNWYDELRRRVPVPMMSQGTPMRSSLSHAPYSASGAAHVSPGTPMNPSFSEAATIVRPSQSPPGG